MPEPLCGEVWLADLDPTRGHEQAGRRPLLIVSDDRLNRSGAGLVYAAAISTKGKGISFHVPLDPPEGGVKQRSFVLCEQMRSLPRDRLVARWGTVSEATLAEVAYRLRVLLAM